ncbi:hypothetical protein [Halolamina salifodinae]|uniref:Uncharacterized protein n=1 Tax=Halolamina salifodinae TaxID=1202767 RepID=A0A8T4GX43_9EURY|nr:hypothetical protein [Halolamina salifodinae]MBP1987577.1 hypothetical protein [Halolamina salifodinae]
MTDLNRVSRRGVIKGLGASVGISSIPGLSIPVAGKVNRTKRVVIARGGLQDEPIATEKVPKEWLNHREEVKSIEEQVHMILSKYDRYNGISLTNSDKASDGVSYPEITVHMQPAESQAPSNETIDIVGPDDIPETVEELGINPSNNLKTNRIKTVVEGGTKEMMCRGEYSPNPFPGGLYVNSPGGYMTSGVRIYHNKKYKSYMYSVNHGFTSKDPAQGECVSGNGGTVTDVNGEPIATGTDMNNISHDWILAEPETGVNISGKIVTGIREDGESIDENLTTVSGYLTDEGIGTVASENRTVTKFGATTGYSDGQVIERGKLFRKGCIDYYLSAIQTDTRGAQGDSGGPIWYDLGEDAALLSLISAGKNYDSTDTYPGCNGGDMLKMPQPVSYPIWRVIENNPFSIGGGAVSP